MRVTFYTLGCKVNQNETGALAQLFEENGYTVVSNEESADVYIVNSCTVTNFGDQKSRKWLRRAKRENPGAVTVLTGCYPQAFPEEAAEIAEADVVTGSGNRRAILADVQKVLDSQTDLRDLWGFVYDIPQDHWVVAPDGGCDLYCIFPQDPDATLFVYETSLTDDAENPLQRGKQLYYSEDGQPILLLCNISDIAPNTEVELYPSTGEELVFSPFLSGENGHVVEAEGVCDFTIYPEGDDWETDTSPWSLEGNWLETGRDTDEGYFDTDPADADRMCFLPTDADTEGDQLPLTASYITPYPELNVEEADLFYQEGTPEVPFRSNQEWYATFTGEDGSRYAVTLEDEDTLALKFYLDGGESYLSLVNTVYFARQEAMG